MLGLKGAEGAACAISLSRRASALELRLKQGERLEAADAAALTEAFAAWSDEMQATQRCATQAT